MNPTDLTLELLKLADGDAPHCPAELEPGKPFSHWKEHCVNCGSHKSRRHRRNDCPTQHYEKEPSKRANLKEKSQ